MKTSCSCETTAAITWLLQLQKRETRLLSSEDPLLCELWGDAGVTEPKELQIGHGNNQTAYGDAGRLCLCSSSGTAMGPVAFPANDVCRLGLTGRFQMEELQQRLDEAGCSFRVQT